MHPRLYVIAREKTTLDEELAVLEEYLKQMYVLRDKRLRNLINDYVIDRKSEIDVRIGELEIEADKLFAPWFFEM
ncbi:hypothetical protein P4679_30785 [Priestia megaterium]|uniref:hypothetical protein n=1 Tax=Priestia megaterium TaxID=1404 RepID=UPI002E24D1DC|nr:hypothetical protein [Priestia megaterium]